LFGFPSDKKDRVKIYPRQTATPSPSFSPWVPCVRPGPDFSVCSPPPLSSLLLNFCLLTSTFDFPFQIIVTFHLSLPGCLFTSVLLSFHFSSLQLHIPILQSLPSTLVTLSLDSEDHHFPEQSTQSASSYPGTQNPFPSSPNRPHPPPPPPPPPLDRTFPCPL